MSLSVTRAWFQPSACACEIYSLLRLFAKQGIAKYLTKLVVESCKISDFKFANFAHQWRTRQAEAGEEEQEQYYRYQQSARCRGRRTGATTCRARVRSLRRSRRPAAQSDKAEFDDKSLLGTFVTFSRRINEQLDKIKDAIDTLGRAAAIASKIGSQDDRRQAQEAAERLIEEHRELKFVLDALVYLASKGNARAYRMSSDTTDFQALIEDTVVQLKVRSDSARDHLTAICCKLALPRMPLFYPRDVVTLLSHRLKSGGLSRLRNILS